MRKISIRWTILFALLLMLIPAMVAGSQGADPSPDVSSLVFKSYSPQLEEATFEVHIDNSPSSVSSLKDFEAEVRNGGEVIDSLYIADPDLPDTVSPSDTEMDYTFTLEVPKDKLGELTVKACVSQGNESAGEGCISKTLWIPQEPSLIFSGDLDVAGVNPPKKEMDILSDKWILTAETCGEATIHIDASDALFTHEDYDDGKPVPSTYSIKTWWRSWDSTSDEDGNLENGEVVDTGWRKVGQNTSDDDEIDVTIPPAWSGEIYFRLKIERESLADRAGKYDSTFIVAVPDLE